MLFPRKFLPYFHGIFLLIVLVGASFIAYRGQADRNIRDASELSKKLQGFVVPDVVVGGKIYVVDNGAVMQEGVLVPPKESLPVLRTAYFSIANRLNPILALEGTDPEKLAVAVTKLKDSLRAFSSDYDAKTQKLLARNFYPISFLETLPSLEKGRLTVLTHPTPKNTAAYGVALLDALEQYRAALAESISAFATFRNEHGKLYVFPGGSTSFETIEGALASFDEYARIAQKRAETRLACLKGNTECEPLVLPRLAEVTSYSFLPFVLPFQHERIRSLLTVSERARSEAIGETFNEQGVVILSQSACMPGVTPLYGYLWQIDTEAGVPALRFQPLDELYFYDLRGREALSGFYGRMREKGLEFATQSISNLYECPDSGLDLGRASTVFVLARAIADHPLFLDTTTHNLTFKKIAEEERKIASIPFFIENAVTTYAANLSTLIQEKGEQALARETSLETVIEMERRITLLRSRSALLDEQIGTIISMNGGIKGINTVAGEPIPLPQLYMGRSYPSLLYLAGNESIMPLSVSFFKKRAIEPLSKFRLIPYSKLHETYTDEEILRIINTSIKTYREADINL